MNKELLKLIREKIIKEEMDLDSSIEYIFNLKGGKEDGK